jgi:hypothetical protein
MVGVSDNTITILRDVTSGQTLAQMNTAGILSCESQRSFWVSWAEGTVSFGSGTVVEQNRVLYFKDPNFHPVNALSVKTPVGILGNFSFEHFGGKVSTSCMLCIF